MRIIKLVAALIAALGMTAFLVPQVAASNDPPPGGGTVTGDWNVTNDRAYAGVNILIDRGSLTLDNTNLQFRMDYSGQNSIEVQSGGKLVIRNRSAVFATYPDRHFFFRIRPQATAYLANSTFCNLGNQSTYSVPENNGVYIASEDVTVDSCSFSNSTFGIYLDRVSPPVRFCVFCALDYIGICAPGSRSQILGNDFCGTYYGVYASNFGSLQISNCTFKDNGRNNAGAAALFSDFSTGRFHHNNISSAASGMGVYCLESASPVIDNCTIGTTNNTGVYTDTHAAPRISDCNITSKNSSAVLCTGNSSLEIDRSSLSSVNYIGAYATAYSAIRMGNCTVRFPYYNALYLDHYSAMTVSDTNLEARSYGVICSASRLELQRVNITSTTNIGIVITGASAATLDRVSVVSSEAGISASCDGRGAVTMRHCALNAKNSAGLVATGTSVDIVDSSVYSTYSYGLYSYDRGILSCTNSTVATGSSNPVIYLDRGGGSFYNFTNVVFDEFKVQFTEPTSALDLYWFLSVTVLWQSFSPAAGAAVNVTDINGTVVLEGETNSRGELFWNPIREYRRTQAGWHNFTSHDITAYRNGVSKMERRAIKSNTNVRVLLSDPDPPVVDMAYPPNGAYLRTSGIEVRGTAQDYVSGVARVDYRVDDGAWTPARGLEKWSFDVELADGQHMLRARASDAAGSAREAAASVFVDTQISLELEYPPQGAMLNCTRINVTGVAEPYSNVTANGLGALVESDGIFTIPLQLEEGPQTITVIATDAAGNILTILRQVTIDTVPPTLALASPANGSATSNKYVVFNGTVETDARLYVGGAICPVEDGGFSVMLPLAEGDNAVSVTALDGAGNANVMVVHVVSDTSPPTLKITSPMDGDIVSRPVVVVFGDSDGVSVLVDGVPATLDGDHFSRDVLLEEGTNDVEIESRDLLGNENSTAIRIILDTRPPFLLVASPPAGHMTNVASLSIMGLSEPGAVVTVNGQRATNSNGSVNLTIKLTMGDNILEIKAVDSAGNAAFANRTVVLDQTPPPLTITEPASGLRTPESRITVRGATDPGCAVTINGEAAQVDRKGRFAREISLGEGDNTLVVTSVDMGGNPTTKLVKVVRTGALAISNVETPVLLVGLAVGAAVGAAAGFALSARMRKRQAVHVAPEEPVPGGYDFPDEPPEPGPARRAPEVMARTAPDGGAALPSVPEAEPLEGGAIGSVVRERQKEAGRARRKY
jgi:hypothetical protein